MTIIIPLWVWFLFVALGLTYEALKVWQRILELKIEELQKDNSDHA